jgi:hypothetical protein
MSNDLHARGLKLIAKARVEGLSESERDWLAVHTQECEFCNEQALQTDRALRALRGTAIPLPHGLAERTQFRVRLRAQQLQEREPRQRWLWITCGLSWALGVASAPYVWRIFEWLGQQMGAPRVVWEIGFGLWWTIPAVVAAVVMLLENGKQAAEGNWSAQEK